MKKLLLAAVVGAVVANSAFAAGRDTITAVGSSTVFPFATVVAEQFGKGGKFATPKIESTGTGGGMKLFCAGVGIDTPDMTNASRRMKQSEFEMCQQNGVKDITEMLIGYDGIVVANSKAAEKFSLTRKDLYLALAKDVPNPKGGDTLVPNPYKTWKEVNADLPDMKIEVMGPPPTSGTRDAFVELVMEHGCKGYDFIKSMEKTDKSAFKAACMSVREDGAYVEAGENDNLVVQKLEANKNALGIFGFSYLDQNADKIQASTIDGAEAQFETIASGDYSVSRPLFVYIKKAHVDVVPGMSEYITEFTSEKAFGNDGYLTEKGLIPLDDAKREEVRKAARGLDNLSL